ncbi:hypothetical protein BBJ28_00024553, partial [Nothophytophthora sp. Chile5]
MIRERAVVEHAIETRLIQDDENDARGEESRDDVGENAGHNGEESGEVSGTVDDKGGDEMVRASQIDCSVALSANTVDALFRSDREGGETPDLSQNIVGRAFELSQPDTADTMDVTEHTVVIGAFQRLLSEMEPDSDSGDESVEEAKDDRGCDDDGGPLAPRDPADVNLMKPGDHRDGYESLSSNSDYGQFSDDDYVEPVRPQPDEDGSDDEESPHMDAAFIEALGGSLSIDQMDQNALQDLKWSAASSVFEDEVSCFRGLAQETAHPIPGLRARKDSPLDLMFYFLPKSPWMRITRETNRVKRQTVDQRARFERAR